ncbi:MAG: magnesium and cobalt exporter, family [Actinomycetota bacterium]|nr:magnesium and cobalt exporter, family [Actinomycetota bacterium]
MSQTDWLTVAGIGVLLVTSAFFAMAETAFVRMNRIRAMSLEEEGRKGAKRLALLLQEPENTLNLVLLFLLIGQLVAGTLVGVLFEGTFGGYGVLIGTVGEVIIFFVLAEVAPKTYAVQHTESAALRLSGPLWAITSFPPLKALSRFLIWVANVILPGKGLKKGPYTTEEDIRTMADVAADEQVIEREERRLIHSIFEFGDTVVREVMVPRPDMVGVETDGSVDAALEKAIEAGYSRLPAYGEGPDDILGLVYLKDIVRRTRENGGAHGTLRELVRPAVFVPEQKRVAELLREMQKDKFHMAIVIDEYGGTAGLVTLEDLLEEIVGEIVDEYDVEAPRVERLPDGGLRVAGGTPIDEVNELLDIELPDTDWDTVGGLMFNLLGHVPDEGESVDFQGLEFRAERVQGRRILTVRITPKESEPAESAAP